MFVLYAIRATSDEFAGLHILMRAIPDGPTDAGRRLSRYWYRESRCQVRTGWQKLCAFVYSWLYLLILAYLSSRSVKICVNPRLTNYLPAFGPSTTVVSALQIHLFMQNEPKFRKTQMNVNKVLTKDYEKRTLGQLGKTNPIRTQTNPKRTQLKPIKCQNKPNSNPTCRGVASGEAGNKANFKSDVTWI